MEEETPRSIQLLEQSLKSEVTRKSYKRELRVFLEFTGLESYDVLVSLEPKQFQIHLENIIGKEREETVEEKENPLLS